MGGEGQNIIDIGFSIDKLTAEKKQVLDLFVDLFGKLQEYDGTKFNPLGNGGLADFKKSITDGAAVMSQFSAATEKYNKTVTDQYNAQAKAKKTTDDLSLAEKQHQKNLQDTIATKAKISEADTNAANDRAIEIQRLKAITAEVNNNAKAYLSEIGSVNEARATIAQLTAERNKQNASTTEGKARIEELNAAINKQNDFIKENVSALEQQKINIGNYTGAISVLKVSLDSIGARLEGMAAAGDNSSEAFQRLTLEQTLLQAELEKQQAGFSSVTQELRSMKNALDALDVAGLKNTETFQQINAVYTEAKQKVNDLHKEQAILTTDAPALTALTGVARGLGGAYAFGAGAAQLFGDENDKLSKELNKLVAIMTFLQGLEETVRVLKERNAIVTALEAEASKALAFVKKVEAAIFGDSAIATQAETDAKIVNAEANIVNTEAAEANAAGVEINTVAMEGTVIATEAATAATLTFTTALISTGIGAILVGLIYGITKLVGAISDWISADERAEKAQAAVTAATSELLATTKELNEAYKVLGKERIDNLQKEADLTKDAGKNQFITLDNEKTITEARLELAKKYVDQKKIDQTVVDGLHQREIDALEITAGFEQALRVANRALGEDDSKENKRRVEDLEKAVKQQQADAKNVSAEYAIARDALKEVADSEHALNDNRVKTAKAAAEQLATLTAAAVQRQYDLEKDGNDRILSLDASTEAQRIAAVKGNFGADSALNAAKISAIQKNIDDQSITEAEGASQIADIRTAQTVQLKKSLDDQLKIRIEYNDRFLSAQNAISKNGNESDADVQEAITKDVQKELDTRLNALKRNIDDKTTIIEDDYRLQLALAKEHGKTQEEIDQLDGDRQKSLVDLTANTQKEIYDIVTSYGEKKLKAIEDQNKTGQAANRVSEDYNSQLEQLDKALNSQTISYQHYINAKRNLDNDYAIKKDQADEADDQKALDRIKDFEQKQNALQLFFAQAALDRAKVGGSDKEIADAQAKVDALKDIQIKAAGDEKAVTDKLDKDKKKTLDDQTARNLAADKFLHDQENQLAQDSFNLATSLVDASYEKKINAIQHTIDIQDQQAQAEEEAIGRSTLSTRQQAEEEIIISTQQRARDTEAKKEEKAEKIAEAKFDRDVAVAKAIWAGAQAEIAALGEYGGTPYAFAIAAVIGALTAVQVATILAKPIPTYAEGIGIPGKGQHPGGLAWAGEEYSPEVVSMPGRAPFIVDKPTLLDMPAMTSVLPISTDDIVFELGGIGMRRGMAMINNYQDRNTNVEDAIRVQTTQLIRAYKKSQRKIVNVIKINTEQNGLSQEYMNKKILGKR